MGRAVDDLISEMRAAVPQGRALLSVQERSVLRKLTLSLLSAVRDCESEYLRYLAVRERSLALPMETTAREVAGKRVLVTGGTGCVGSTLIRLLSSLGPQRLVSVSRGITHGWPATKHAEYVYADVRDSRALAFIIAELKPHIVFHVAAQRNPGLAEQAVYRTVTTNVLGTQNVISAAASKGVPRVVLASTGKAVIPYTSDVYASSKRVAEWLGSNAAARGDIILSAARFTHLVDNSILHRRIIKACNNGVIRLHEIDGAFYVQSARESAQLLISAALDARPGRMGVYAISDLGYPINLLTLALGALSCTGSSAAIYFSGRDPGYSGNVSFPGQYDPQLSWEISPLMNAFEARNARRAPYDNVDFFPRESVTGGDLDDRYLALRKACAEGKNAKTIRNELDALSWSVFESTLDSTPLEAFLRIVKLGISHSTPEAMAHPKIVETIERRASLALSSRAAMEL